jgi:hypothetical protein
MKGKTKMLTNFKKNLGSHGGNVTKRNSKSMQFFFF